MSEGEGAGEPAREQDKPGLQGWTKAAPLRSGHSGCCRGRRGGTSGTGEVSEVVVAGVHCCVRVRVRVRVEVRVSVRLGLGLGLGLGVQVRFQDGHAELCPYH